MNNEAIVVWIPTATLILTVLLAYATIYRQQQANLVIQEKHLSNEIKADLFRDFVPAVQQGDRLLTDAAGEVRSSVNWLRLYLQGWPFDGKVRASVTSEAVSQGLGALSDVMLALERHEIVFGRFHSIHHALGKAHQSILDAYGPFSDLAALYLPFVNDAGKVIVFETPEDAQLNEFSAAGDRLIEALYEAAAYMSDVVVEAQNELLGDLFGREVPPRRPADPTKVVLKRDPVPAKERPSGGRWS